MYLSLVVYRNMCAFLCLPAPDVPNLSGLYLMTRGSDYEQQTPAHNAINDEKIGENEVNDVIRTICYDQPIYDDMCVEPDEWIGLTLGVARASVFTVVTAMYNQSAIVIQDNDSKLS